MTAPWRQDPDPRRDPGRVVGRGMTWPGYSSFVLIGWTSLLVPSLIRAIEHDFDQPDAGLGLLYLVSALLYVVGSLGVGVLAGRIGRRAVLPAAALLIGAGLLTEGLASAWEVLLAGVAITAVGAGAVDAGVNALFLDLFPAGRGGALNRLHLFFSVGAMAAPMVIGWLVEAGVGWRLLMVGSAGAALAVSAALAAAGQVPVRRPGPGSGGERATGGSGVPLPLLALGVAIGCCVAAELGVSSWLVGFLAAEPLAVATFALGLFWAGRARGRRVSIHLADRYDLVVFGSWAALLAALAIAAAVLGPGGAISVAMFGVAGFGLGPIYPVIMALAGTFYPARASSVSGMLTAAGVVGSIVYPPAIGLASASVGLGFGMLGAAVMAACCSLAVVASGRSARRAGSRADAATPVDERPAGADPDPGSG